MLLLHYNIVQKIGEGGMAAVYLAEHNKLQQSVAVKVLKKEFVHNENIRKRFLAEARNIFKMSHPNIIKVTDLIDEGDTVAFAMEYIEGQTLKEYLDVNGKIPDDEIKKLFVQMLDAVGYVHEQGLVHRDIKPSNFMISAKGIVKLLDFGIAKNMDTTSSEHTMTGTTQSMGTPMYMSPEQIKSTKDVTHQTDIYSLGVVLWQMVTGRKPYDSNELSLPEIQVSILKEDLPPSKTKWDAIIKLAMQKSVDLRYQQCALMKEDVIKSKIRSTKITKENELNERTVIENVSTDKKQKVNPISSNYKNKKFKSVDYIEEQIPLKRKISPFYIILGILLLVGIFYLLGKSDQRERVEMSGGVMDTLSIADSTASDANYFDQNGNKIEMVEIGTQTWMKKNLNVDKFRNGDPIPHVKSQKEWVIASKRGQPAWCYFNNDPQNENRHGRLYNWYAVNDSRGLAPDGWHIPTENEWQQFVQFYGGFPLTHKTLMKNNLWSVELSGVRCGVTEGFCQGEFMYGTGNESFWWSSEAYGKNDAYIFELNRIENTSNTTITELGYGCSVRCIRN